MTLWIIGGLAAVVLAGEPIAKLLWANRGKLSQLKPPPAIQHKDEPLDYEPRQAPPPPAEPTPAERRARAFRAIEEVVEYFDDEGDSEGAEEARAAGRLLFGKPQEPTTVNRRG